MYGEGGKKSGVSIGCPGQGTPICKRKETNTQWSGRLEKSSAELQLGTAHTRKKKEHNWKSKPGIATSTLM